MSHPTDRQKPQVPAPKPVLRLVKQDAPSETAAAAEPPKPRSHLARFMAAYADAIDRDVALLLDL